MTRLQPIAPPRFYAECHDQTWFVVDRDRAHEPPTPRRRGMSQARDTARMLNAQHELRRRRRRSAR